VPEGLPPGAVPASSLPKEQQGIHADVCTSLPVSECLAGSLLLLLFLGRLFLSCVTFLDADAQSNC
jgi:hypothetical protein